MYIEYACIYICIPSTPSKTPCHTMQEHAMRCLRLWLWFLTLLPCALADLAVVRPSEGATFSASSGATSVTVQWEDMGGAPELSTVTRYVFTLCSGPSNDIRAVTTLATVAAADITGTQYAVSIPNKSGADGRYFIQVFAESPVGYSIHYSGHFRLNGMAGPLAPVRESETVAPTPQTMITTGGVPAPIQSASFSVTYALQTGLSRFAPMQRQPRTKVTATHWTRQHPTSAVTYYATIRHSVQQITTITPGWDYTVGNQENWATPAPFPYENGGWYERRAHMTLTTRKLNRNRIGNSVTA